MSFATITDRRQRKSRARLVLLALLLVGLLAGVALLVSLLVGREPADSSPPAQPTVDTSTGSSTEPVPTAAAADPIQLQGPTRIVAGVGTGWPAGGLGGLSAAADYVTSSTIELDLLRRRLEVMYADAGDTASEVRQIISDSARGRANLGVPPGGSSGQAGVDLTPIAGTHRSTDALHVEGYVLVRRQLVTYDGQRLPADLLPVPFVVERINGDWKLTADGVEWSPPSVPTPGTTAEQEGWRELVPTR